MKKKQKQIRLSRYEKISIASAVCDAIYQQIVESEEYLQEEAVCEALRELERMHENRDINDFMPTIKKEISAIFGRMYDAIEN